MKRPSSRPSKPVLTPKALAAVQTAARSALRYTRTTLALSQCALGDALALDQSAVSRMEAGHQAVTLEVLAACAALLKISLSALLERVVSK